MKLLSFGKSGKAVKKDETVRGVSKEERGQKAYAEFSKEEKRQKASLKASEEKRENVFSKTSEEKTSEEKKQKAPLEEKCAKVERKKEKGSFSGRSSNKSIKRNARKQKCERAEICLALNCETMDDIRKNLAAYLGCCTYVEWCVNNTAGSNQWSKEEYIAKLEDVRKWTRGKKLIVKYEYDGDEAEISNRIIRWSSGKADYVDINALNPELIRLLKDVKKHRTQVILSYHNFDGMVNKHEIAEQYLRMEGLGGDILKIACMANEEADTYEILEGAAMYTTIRHHKPIIAIAMGEEGQVSRICAGDFGSVISYAAGTKSTAPGQFRCDELKNFMDRYYGEL